MTHHLDIDALTLKAGGHNRPDDGMCVMEAVAYFAHEPHSDHPACVSPVIGAFLRRWNDDLDNDGRQMLKPYIPKVVGTNTGPADDERRSWLVTDWMVRVYMPAWLRLANLNEQADAVAGLPALVDSASWTAMWPLVQDARSKANAAGAAAWDAAGDAAWDAAGAAARAAAWDAAGDAARAAARDAAGAAARAAARDAARDAAWAAAGAAAWDAAGDAAGAAAWDAARDVLKPTTVNLQQSARDLLDQLIAVGVRL